MHIILIIIFLLQFFFLYSFFYLRLFIQIKEYNTLEDCEITIMNFTLSFSDINYSKEKNCIVEYQKVSAFFSFIFLSKSFYYIIPLLFSLFYL